MLATQPRLNSCVDFMAQLQNSYTDKDFQDYLDLTISQDEEYLTPGKSANQQETRQLFRADHAEALDRIATLLVAGALKPAEEALLVILIRSIDC